MYFDIDDHPIIFSIMVTIIAIVIVVGLVIVTYTAIYKVTSGTYEYVDLDDNMGHAENCFIRDGQNVCHLKDGTVITVKQFKKID